MFISFSRGAPARGFLSLVFRLCPATLLAQQWTGTATSPARDIITSQTAMSSAGSSNWLNVSDYASNAHTLDFEYSTQPSAITVELQCSVDDGATVASTIGTSTSTTGAQISGTATCNAIRVLVSGLTGTFRSKNVYRGLSGASAAGGATAANQEEEIAFLESIDDAVNDSDPVAVFPQATSTGGTTGCNILSAATTNATSCGTAATGFYGFDITNTTLVAYYLRLYNSVGAPTCSSATGFVRSIPIPPASAAGGVGGIILSLTVPNTSSFTTGLGYCITAGSSSTDNVAAVTGIFGEIRYKQ